MELVYTTVEVFSNVYIVRNTITKADMSAKRHIVYVQNMNTHGEMHVGDIKLHFGNSRSKVRNINARFMGMFHSLRRMVFYICETTYTTDLQRSQNAMGNTQTKNSMQI